MGGVFEEMCRAYVWRTTALPFTPTRVGAWWDRTGKNDLDVVAYDDAGNVLMGECKWGAGRAEDIALLRERGEQVARELGCEPLLPADRPIVEAIAAEAAGATGAAVA